ncbi:type 4a pilus biogenesis protein PilO [Desulfurivibrio dismutans]|uniref:type 4a pilus biogenesis protein PilO n=1 Tax=Desulfurivibrio dismutans TaxID=1398908 RepID=UPI0023DAE138|nr:type 4a pilus biogenesis protein PilO [Desulfurivibrio alkaliphilus]MDF1615726.1 type 4a pilus biogenesis protein PilO [Desulfurivibrio alkaliphilus]
MNQKLKPLLRKLDVLLETKTGMLTGLHKLLILVGVCALPVAIFTFLVFIPKAGEMDQARDRIQNLESEIARLARVARELDRHREETREVELRLEELSLLLPEEKEIPLLLTSISNLGTNSGLDFMLFRPQSEVRQEFYAEIPVSISVRGPYHNVGAFLDRISKLPRIVTVQDLNMTSPTRTGNRMYLTTNITLLTYRFIEPETAPPPPARSRRR